MNTNKESVPIDKPINNSNPKLDFEKMVQNYLASNPFYRNEQNKTSEMEVRFGTNSKVAKPLSKIDYDNVVQKLYAAGFVCSNPTGLHLLRIQNEYTDSRTGVTRMSNIRAEISGIDMVQEYCRMNSIQKLLDLPSSVSSSSKKIIFTQKTSPGNPGDPSTRPVDFTDFNFRVAYQMEQDISLRSPIAKNIISKWNDSKKIFRYMNRVRFSHPVYPVYADISIVKGSKKTNRIPMPQYTIQEAEVFTSPETYEIELEIANTKVGPGSRYNSAADLIASIRKCIRIVLSGIQSTNYPIGYSERDAVHMEYMKIVQGDTFQKRRIYGKDFIGPSSYTLQLENIMAETEESNIPNIRKNYTVTDKADGERRLLFVSENGRIYMIDTNMNVIFTGTKCMDKTFYQSIVDGEFVKYDKRGNPLNLYAAFDIYYINNKSVREFGFVPELETDDIKKYRLPLLNRFIQKLKPKSIFVSETEEAKMVKESGGPSDSDKMCDIRIVCKQFYSTIAEDVTSNTKIFEGCSRILSDMKDGLFEYQIDGLIFTPTNTGVGASQIGKAGPLFKTTWERSFKWKPPKYNTIDFLVSTKKDKTGKDEIHNIFKDGLDMSGLTEVKQYKILVLRCGFDERKHGYLNPWSDLIHDKIPKVDELDNEETYKPVPFQPTNPSDPTACYCYVELKKEENGNMVMKTEEGEYFEEDMIVEFSYDETLTGAWKWIPLRVRYDKTSELRAGLKNYGNAYHVANSNWTSIHHPIKEEMISSGTGIPEFNGSPDDVYYNRTTNQSNTKALRDFHNLFVKRKLIMGVSQRRDTLIDLAVGKAGDLPKWIGAKLSFVFGIDVSKDNIQNHLDGACARYLNERKKHKNMPDALFVNGTSGANIRNGKAFASEKDREIARAVFGQGPKDREQLGNGVYKQYGVGHDGFQICSVQFALHYFFENKTSFHEFMRNVSECTKVGGYFIGTCYDGNSVFQLLSQKNKGESITIMEDGVKIYELTKQYSQTGFPEDESGLGYAVDVYQETINKEFREYLVNYTYLVRTMEDYGFVPAEKSVAQKMGLPNSSGKFDELFTNMENELKRNPERASDYRMAMNMSYGEKRISFMNRYFIFKKVRNVNTDKITKILNKPVDSDDDEVPNQEKVQEKVQEKAPNQDKPKKKTGKLNVPKLVIQNYVPLDTLVQANPLPDPSSEPIIIKRKVIKKPTNM